MMNLFIGTDPELELLGDSSGERKIRITRTLDEKNFQE